MKRNFRCLSATIMAIAFTGLYLTVHAQRPVRAVNKLAEAKEFENSKEVQAVKISAASDDTEKAQALVAYLVKAVLHRVDPATYPIDDDANSMEQVALKATSKMSPSTLARAKTKFTAFIADGPRKARLLGKFKDIDFKKKSITPDIKKVTRLNIRPVQKDDGTSLHQEFTETQTIGVGGSTAGNTPAYNYMDWILRAVHCVDETNPESGDDDIVVGGLLIGASMNTKSANTLISCSFDDGDYCNHGAHPFGYVSLNSTNTWPKDFYLVLKLVEVDSDEREVAAALTDALNMIGQATGYGAAVGMVTTVVNIFVGLFFDDDIFPSYTVPLTLGGPNAFGSDGRSDNWHTGNINGHGGTYRVGFYNKLR